MRSADYLIRLASWASALAGNAFIWGETDCAMLCFEAADVVSTGRSIASEYRGRWSSRRSALRFQAVHGDLEAALARGGVFRWNGSPLPGDLVLHQHPTLPFVCGHVVLGEAVLTSNETDGVYLARLSDTIGQPGAFVMRIP